MGLDLIFSFNFVSATIYLECQATGKQYPHNVHRHSFVVKKKLKWNQKNVYRVTLYWHAYSGNETISLRHSNYILRNFFFSFCLEFWERTWIFVQGVLQLQDKLRTYIIFKAVAIEYFEEIRLSVHQVNWKK